MKATHGLKASVLLTLVGGVFGHAPYAMAQPALPATYAAILIEGTYTDKNAGGSIAQAYQPEIVAMPEASNFLPLGTSSESVSQSQQQIIGFTANNVLSNSTSSISTCYGGGGCIISGSLAGNYVALGGCVSVQGFNETFNLSQASNTGLPGNGEILAITASGSLNLGGINVNPGNYEYGQKFPLTCVVQVVANGSASMQTLTGKVTVGDDIVNNNSGGNIVDNIIVAMHVTGSVPDGQGGTITIDEKIGEVSVPNGLSSYSLTMSVLPQGGI